MNTTTRYMTYTGEGSELGMYTIAEARTQFSNVEFEAETQTISVGAPIAADTPVRNVVVLTWRKPDVEASWQDKGGAWLVVTRGFRVENGHDYLTDSALLADTATSEAAAKGIARKIRAYLNRRQIHGKIDIVNRKDVTVTSSNAAVGVYAG